MIEVVSRDGVTIRVYGENAALTETTDDTTGANAWKEGRKKLKAKSPKKTKP